MKTGTIFLCLFIAEALTLHPALFPLHQTHHEAQEMQKAPPIQKRSFWNMYKRELVCKFLAYNTVWMPGVEQ
jgi:hypothetical protein